MTAGLQLIGDYKNGNASGKAYVELEPELNAGYQAQPIETHMAAGPSSIDNAYHAEVTRKYIYKQSLLLSTGLKIAGIEPMKTLRQVIEWPSELEVEYPLAMWSNSSSQTITWSQVDMLLQKAMLQFTIQDEAKMAGPRQRQIILRRAAEAFASTIDANILTALWSGAYQVGKDVATNDKWDNTGSNAPDIPGDFATAMGTLMEDCEKPEGQLENGLFALLPIKAVGYMRMPDVINMIKMTTQDWLKEAWSIDIMFTRSATYANDVILGYKGADTIIHGVLTNPPFPLSEIRREHGIGDTHIVRRYFATKILPYAMGQTTSKNLISITDIFSD